MRKRCRTARKFSFAIVISAILSCMAVQGDAADNSDSPRVLARIDPGTRNFSFDVGVDGHTLHVLSLRPPDEYVLDNYDISNPKKPIKASSATFAKAPGQQFELRADRIIVLRPGGDSVGIVDAAHPDVINEVQLDGHWSHVLPSDDGKTLRLLYPKEADHEAEYPNGMFIDVSDTRRARPITDLTAQMLSWARNVTDHFPPLNIREIPGRIVDARDHKAIATGAYTSNLRLYDTTQEGAPKLIREFPTASSVGKLTSVDAIALFGFSPSPAVLLYSIEERPFTANELRATYGKSKAAYQACLNRSPSSNCSLLLSLPAELADAGADTLLNEKPPGINEAERVLILNDYGFWLDKDKLSAPLRRDEVPHSVEVLRKVTELAPRRFVAWLNLGDALVNAIPVVPDIAQKRALAFEAERAFQTYRTVTGMVAANANVATALRNRQNLPNNVCSYVADAFQAGRLGEISGGPAKLSRPDGTTAIFSVQYNGTAYVPQMTDESGNESPDNFYLPRLWGGDLIEIVPYDGISYVVYVPGGTRLAYAVQPNIGRICEFDYLPPTKRLVTNSLPAVCQKMDEGPLNEVPSTEYNIIIEIPRAETPLHREPVKFTSFSAIELDGKPATLAKFELFSGAGAGCDIRGIAFIGDDQLEKSARNDALFKAQNEINDCRSAKASTVTVDGNTYLELSGMTGSNRATNTQRLFSLRGDQLELVCRIDLVPNIVAR